MSTTRTALARLYRPRRFAEMATQEHVSETLRAAVSRGRVAHAYLFAGPRGVGKTTAARVLAMALNCPNRTAEGEPCGECESCERIWSGKTSLDVVEIDAASNRGVDDARDLRERAMYAPTDERRFKVYIIDEAHMLTREAWNALLKILEEPPPRVIFVFATTEPQKIQQAAPPILSRCQRFDFRRLSVQSIVERLHAVLGGEGVSMADDALVTIARRAEGGMRDALSLLDQVLSFADQSLTAADVRRVLGLTGEELYLELFEIIAERRHGDVFRFVQRLVDDGYDLAEFYRGLADALRALLVSKLEGPEQADVRDDLRDGFAAAAARFATGDLLRMLAQVAELDADGRFRKSTSPRLLLEALLLRFAHLDRTVELEQLIRAAGGVAFVDDAPRPPVVSPGGDLATARGSSPVQAGGGAVVTPTPSAVARAQGAPGGSGAAPAPSAVARAQGAPGASGATPAPPAPARGPEDRAPERAPAHSRQQDGPPPIEWGDLGDAAPSPAADVEQPAAEVEAAPAAARAASPGTSAVQAELRALVGGKALPAGIGPFLRAAQVAEVDEQRIVLELPPGPGLERLSNEATLRALEAALAQRLGHSRSLEVRGLSRAAGRPEQAGRLTPERVKQQKLARMSRDEPLLGRLVEEWELELLE